MAEKPQGYLFFDKDVRLQVAKPIPKLFIKLKNPPQVQPKQIAHAWEEAVRKIFLHLPNQRPKRIETLEEGAVLHLPTTLSPQEIIDLGGALQRDPRVTFAFPIVLVDGLEHQVEEMIYLKLDERLTSAERKRIIDEIASELKGRAGLEDEGIVQHGSNELVYMIQLRFMRSVKDPFVLARRLALSRTKGITWAIPGLKRLTHPVTLDVSVEVIETGERGKDVSVLVGDRFVYILRITSKPPAELAYDKVMAAIQGLVVHRAGQKAFSPLFTRRGELKVQRQGDVWEGYLPLQIYKPGQYKLELPSLTYRDPRIDKEVTIGLPPASVFIPSRAYGKQRVNPLKELSGISLSQITPPHHTAPTSSPLLLRVVGGGAIFTGLLILAILLLRREPSPIPSQGQLLTLRRYQDMVRNVGENLDHLEPVKVQEIRRMAWDLQVACRDGVLPASLQDFATQLLNLSEACFRPEAVAVDEETRRKLTETLGALEAALNGEGAL